MIARRRATAAARRRCAVQEREAPRISSSELGWYAFSRGCGRQGRSGSRALQPPRGAREGLVIESQLYGGVARKRKSCRPRTPRTAGPREPSRSGWTERSVGKPRHGGRGRPRACTRRARPPGGSASPIRTPPPRRRARATRLAQHGTSSAAPTRYAARAKTSGVARAAAPRPPRAPRAERRGRGREPQPTHVANCVSVRNHVPPVRADARARPPRVGRPRREARSIATGRARLRFGGVWQRAR